MHEDDDKHEDSVITVMCFCVITKSVSDSSHVYFVQLQLLLYGSYMVDVIHNNKHNNTPIGSASKQSMNVM